MPGSEVAEPTAEISYSISELAREFGITARAIRFYEDKNLLQPERCGLTRVYRRRDKGRLKLILRGKRLGFSLADISEMLDLYDPHGGGQEQLRLALQKCQQRLTALRQQRQDIDEVIMELQEDCDQIAAQFNGQAGT